jgi:hypothetical protein
MASFIKINADEIGGRTTDIEQIGYSLHNLIRERFPINEVPRSIIMKMNRLQERLEKDSILIRALVLEVNDECEEEG